MQPRLKLISSGFLSAPRVYVFAEESFRKKVNHESWEGVFVGDDSIEPSSRILNMATMSVATSRNIAFDESVTSQQAGHSHIKCSDKHGPGLEGELSFLDAQGILLEAESKADQLGPDKSTGDDRVRWEPAQRHGDACSESKDLHGGRNEE